MINILIKAFFALIVVIFLIALTLTIYKKVRCVGFKKFCSSLGYSGSKDRIQIVEIKPIDQQRKIIVLALSGRTYVVFCGSRDFILETLNDECSINSSGSSGETDI